MDASCSTCAFLCSLLPSATSARTQVQCMFIENAMQYDHEKFILYKAKGFYAEYYKKYVEFRCGAGSNRTRGRTFPHTLIISPHTGSTT